MVLDKRWLIWGVYGWGFECVDIFRGERFKILIRFFKREEESL